MFPKETVNYQFGCRHLCSTCLKVGIMNPIIFLWNVAIIVLFLKISCENFPFLKSYFLHILVVITGWCLLSFLVEGNSVLP